MLDSQILPQKLVLGRLYGNSSKVLAPLLVGRYLGLDPLVYEDCEDRTSHKIAKTAETRKDAQAEGHVVEAHVN